MHICWCSLMTSDRGEARVLSLLGLTQSECSWDPAHPAHRIEYVTMVDSAPSNAVGLIALRRAARLWHWLVICGAR